MLLIALPILGALIGWDSARRRTSSTLVVTLLVALALNLLAILMDDSRSWSDVRAWGSVLGAVVATKLAIVARRRRDARSARRLGSTS
jgi:hypothetical protein